MQSKTILFALGGALLFVGGANAREAHSAPPSTTTPQTSEVQSVVTGSPDTLVNRGRPNGAAPQHNRRISLTGNGDHVAILLDLNRAEEWSYNRATGALTPIAPGSLYFARAIPGSGVLLTHASSTGAAKLLTLKNDGSVEIPPLDLGAYNLTLRLPRATDSSAHAKSRKAAIITFHLNFGTDGILRDRSPEIAIAALDQNRSATRK